MLNRRKSYSHTFICVAATLLLIFGYGNYVFAEEKETSVTKPRQNQSPAVATTTTTTTTRNNETPVPADGPKTANHERVAVPISTQSSKSQTTANNEPVTVPNATQSSNVTQATANTETTTVPISTQSSKSQTTANKEPVTVPKPSQPSSTSETSGTAAHVSLAEQPPLLSIFLVNDLQYDIFPVHNETGSMCCTDPEAEKCVGGLPSLKKFKDDKANLPQSIWLNAGNTLGGDLFRTLKFDAAVRAMQLLNFTATAVGPSVFKYGGDAGLMYLKGLNQSNQSIVVSNVDAAPQQKSVLLSVGNCSVAVIGYIENTEQDKDIYGVVVKNDSDSVLAEAKRIKNDHKDVITVVIGSSSVNKSKILASNEAIDFVFFSGANWSEEADKSKGRQNVSQFFYEKVEKQSKKTAYVASLRVNHSDVASRFIVGQIELNITNSCTVANATFQVQNYSTTTTSNSALDLIKRELEALQRQNESLTQNNKNLAAEKDLCFHSECSLGNLITDAMVAALNCNGTWSGNVTRIGIFPAVLIKQNKTIPEGNLTVTNLDGLLDQDVYIYSVLLTGRQLKDILKVSINSSSNSNSTDFLHVSRLLQTEYRKDRNNKTEIVSVKTVLATSSSMQLSKIDVNDSATFYSVAVPLTLLEMDSYKKLLQNAVNKSFHSVTIVEAVTKYINNTGGLSLPVIGSRFIRLDSNEPQPSPQPPSPCADHTGTTVAVTLVVAALIVGLIFGVWRWRSIRSHLLPGYVNF